MSDYPRKICHRSLAPVHWKQRTVQKGNESRNQIRYQNPLGWGSEMRARGGQETSEGSGQDLG